MSETSVLLMEMEPVDRASGMNEPVIWKDFAEIIEKEYGIQKKIGKVSRQEYYEMGRAGCLIVQTGEGRLYGDIILIKGVI